MEMRVRDDGNEGGRGEEVAMRGRGCDRSVILTSRMKSVGDVEVTRTGMSDVDSYLLDQIDIDTIRASLGFLNIVFRYF